ncbi:MULTISPECIES: 30S ribosomal protein S20 [Thermonema]|jgi:small subunit ribosomal protein S20|nr:MULTISPECIES: 30S ribosomal protein S20 [Thermonema]
MANLKSAKKRMRQAEKRRLHNRYYKKTTKTFMKRLFATTDKTEAQELLKKVSSMLDKLAKRNIIHKNKAARHKSQLYKHVNSLA